MARQLALMALLGAGLLLFEVLLTRVLAITLFANLAFAAVALALLGMAIGGWIAARHERLDDDRQTPHGDRTASPQISRTSAYSSGNCSRR